MSAIRPRALQPRDREHRGRSGREDEQRRADHSPGPMTPRFTREISGDRRPRPDRLRRRRRSQVWQAVDATRRQATGGSRSDGRDPGRGGRRADPPPEQVPAVDEHDRAPRSTSRSISRACSGPNSYGSLGRMTRFGARAATSASVTSGIALERVGEHVADPEHVEQRRAVGVARERHPRPAPHRDERVVPARREHRRQPRVPIVGAERRRHRRRRAASASARTSPPTSCTDRGDIECTASPASINAAASSQRFSSSFTTTRSGASSTIARDVGMLGAADRRHAGQLAEARARDRSDAERDQRLARRRHQRDDTRRARRECAALTCARAAAPSSLRTPRR